MKKSIAIAAIPLFLGACGTRTVVIEKEATKTQDTTVVEETTPKTVATTPKKSAEELYVDGVAYDWPDVLNTMGKVEVIRIGYTFCGAIDEGMTFNELVDMTVRADIDGGIVGSLLREAIEHFCPQNQWFIDAALNGANA